MPQLSTEERIFLIEHYHKSVKFGRNNGPSVKWTLSKYSEHFEKNPPNKSTLLDLVKKFDENGSVLNQNKGKSGRPLTVRTNNNHGIIFEKVLQSPKKSQRRISQELGIARSSVQRLLKDLGVFSYKIQLLQTLQPQDPHQRANFAARLLALCYEDPGVLRNIWWSDECHVLLSGHVNKQNMRFLGWQKPDECAQKPLHSERVTVWCAVSGHGIIGPYFLEDVGGNAITVTSNVYRIQVIDRFVGDLNLFCDLNGIAHEEQWFQQDGATSHIGRGNVARLEELFPDRLISRASDFPYPPRSPDLTPPDFYLWGHLKEFCFRDPVPHTIPQLKTNIRRVIDSVRPDTLRALTDNVHRRLEACVMANGEHFEHTL